MLRIPRLSPAPDPELVRARLMSLAGFGPPEQAVTAELDPPATADPAATAPTPSGAVDAGRVLAMLALLAVVAAAFLTWRSQGGATSPTVVTAGSPVAGVPGPSPTATPPPAASVVVQVLGVVRRPGVVRLPTGSRVTDALAAAGGVRTGRSTGLLNLARRLVDGEQIVVGPQATSATTTPGSSSTSPARIDLNSADEGALDSLPGVGPVTAAAILAWRGAHGQFDSVDQLREVEGIGPKTFERLAPLVQVPGS